MKTKFILVLSVFAGLSGFSFTLSGKEVPVDKAKEAATNFLMQIESQSASQSASQLKSGAGFELTLVSYSTTQNFNTTLKKSAASGENLLYIFDINMHDGFIIVAGDDEATPILGYSFESSFDVSNVPGNFRKWMEDYKSQIRYLRSDPGSASTSTGDQWKMLAGDQRERLAGDQWKLLNPGEGKNTNETGSITAVQPLITTKWDQGPYYNDQCPYDAAYGGRSVTGCVATAMAQIMKFWNYPERGNGFHSYNHPEFGRISANFGTTTYNWAAMPDIVNSANPAVATLMYNCGVSVDMDYRATSSGAYVVIDDSPVVNCAEYAFEEYFGYAKSLSGVLRMNYTRQAWVELLKTELEAGRPVGYAGFGPGGGHAFVCDGFDPNNYFHFNWGWGGLYDGYFAIDALNPDGTGTGGGAGGYNSGHQAIIGIKPPDNLTVYDLVLYDSVTISEDPLFFIDSFNIHTDIANFSGASFVGDFCAAVFDDGYNFVEYAEILEGANLGSEMHYTNGLDFSNPGSLNMLPGDYYSWVYYRPTGGNWTAVGDGAYSNYLSFEVYYSSDIELYKDFIITTGTTIIQNEPFTVTADILNDGSSTFTGEFEVNLYDMEGAYAATIGTIPADPLPPGYYYPEVTFSTGGVSLDPGTYLMALLHKPDGGDWILSGSSYFRNPIKIIIKEAPLDPDIYEANDSEETPWSLILNYSDNTATVSTEGSNSHVGTDIDFYSLTLDPGFNYSVSARVHDSYSSGNQEIYSNDVIWSYYSDGTWSEVYDDVMPGSIYVSDGGEVLFGVAPFYEGETGTYLLDIQVTRTDNVSTELMQENLPQVYPNPASDMITIEGTTAIDRIDIYDAKGRLMKSFGQQSQVTTLNISMFKEGTFFVHVTRKGITTIHKIVKQ